MVSAFAVVAPPRAHALGLTGASAAPVDPRAGAHSGRP
jgi:hypothetical protein